MTVIQLRTVIKAPAARVFDLSRSIEFHQDSTGGTDEKAVAGTCSGLIGEGQEVTWEARHLGIRQRLTVAVTRYDRPHRFQDAMRRGAFKHMVHDHVFTAEGETTVMTDRFEFSAPLGPLGRFVEIVFLERYLRGFLERRNAHLKQVAESGDWRRYLPALD